MPSKYNGLQIHVADNYVGVEERAWWSEDCRTENGCYYCSDCVVHCGHCRVMICTECDAHAKCQVCRTTYCCDGGTWCRNHYTCSRCIKSYCEDCGHGFCEFCDNIYRCAGCDCEFCWECSEYCDCGDKWCKKCLILHEETSIFKCNDCGMEYEFSALEYRDKDAMYNSFGDDTLKLCDGCEDNWVCLKCDLNQNESGNDKYYCNVCNQDDDTYIDLYDDNEDIDLNCGLEDD